MDRRRALGMGMAGAGAVALAAAPAGTPASAATARPTAPAEPAEQTQKLRVWATRDKLTLPANLAPGIPFSMQLNLTDDNDRAIGTGSVSTMIVDVTTIGTPPVPAPVCYSTAVLELTDPDTGQIQGQLYLAARYMRNLLDPTSRRGAVLGGTGIYSTAQGEHELSSPTPDTLLHVIRLAT